MVMKKITEPQLLTVGELARRSGLPIHRVSYIIKSRKIKPLAKAGASWIYSEADLERIISQAERIERDREQL